MSLISTVKQLYFRFLPADKKTIYLKKICYHVGDNVRIYTNSIGTEPYLIYIGDDVNIASGVRFITHDVSVFNVARYLNYSDEYRLDKVGPIVLKDNCMIGAFTILMPGCSVGKNSVVAAGSIVTKAIPDNEVWGGAPAKFIMSIDEYAAKIIETNNSYPWMNEGKYLIPQFSEEIKEVRKEFFFKNGIDKDR